jgi:hypothetical protein
MITDTPYIAYILPNSRPSQAILGRQPAKAAEGIKGFISQYTNAKFDNPKNIEIVVQSPRDETENGISIGDIIDKTVKLFGQYKQSPVGFHYPSGEPAKQQKYSWHIPITLFEKALQFIIQGHPWPKYKFGQPIELVISYFFQMFKDINRKKQESLEIESHLLVWYSNSSCCCPTINFPFSKPDIEFKKYFENLSNNAPFKMEPKYLRLLSPNKAKTNYISSKIEL